MTIPFDNVAIIMSPHTDQVAIARQSISSGTTLQRSDGTFLQIPADVTKAHRFALCDIPEGEYVCQSGYPFARSKKIAAGEVITRANTDNLIPEKVIPTFISPPPNRLVPELQKRTFKGYRRSNGLVGTRNHYLVIPTSMCAAETARQVADRLEQYVANNFPEVNSIVAIPHTEGCGCASTGQIDRLLTVLKGFALHPNVGGCLIIDLGCEQTDYARVHAVINPALETCGKTADWLTIQHSGGITGTLQKAEQIIKQRLPEVAKATREDVPLAALVLGTECGASDSFSGITANPLIGAVADRIIQAGGKGIMSEIPEMLGTFDMLFPRFRNIEIAQKFNDAIAWYLAMAKKMGVNISDNVVPKNIEGGLINSYLKSLGAVLKGGTTAIEDVIGYGEPAIQSGLNIMQGPGGDLESVTGLVSSGANMVCFSTGYGAVTGSPICPVIKISSTTETFQKLPDIIDIDAGMLLDNSTTLDQQAELLLERLIAIASGEKTATEKMKQRQFQIWTAGKLSL